MKSVSFARRRGEDAGAHRAGDLGVLCERLGGVDQDVVAALDRAVIVGAADLGERRLGDERDGPLGIGGIVVGAARRSGLGRRERAVAKEAVGPAAAVQEVLDEPGPSRRPLVLVAPVVGAHDEDPDGRLAHEAGVDPFEPVVVPAQERGRAGRSWPSGRSRLRRASSAGR